MTVGRSSGVWGCREKKSTHAKEQHRPDVALARAGWLDRFAGVRLDRLVCVDKFGAAINPQRTHGRAPPGERVVSYVPHGHWKMISTIAAMTARGTVASASFDGATDTDTFTAFVEDGLVRALRPGDVVVMDDLAPHKAPAVRRAVEKAGATLLYLPPYSPDFNPIEMAFSKVKGVLRSTGERTVAGPFDAVGTALARVTPDDAHNYIRHCGYGL